jgi:hypothetical protein
MYGRNECDVSSSSLSALLSLLLLLICWRDIQSFVGYLASLRLTTTEAETHNERLCAHMLGDHTGHMYPYVCANVCMCGMCIFK